MNAYEILGVSCSAGMDECRRAYRRRCRECHPDSGGNVEEFREVQRAWEAIQSGKGLGYPGFAHRTRQARPVLRHTSLFRFARQ